MGREEMEREGEEAAAPTAGPNHQPLSTVLRLRCTLGCQTPAHIQTHPVSRSNLIGPSQSHDPRLLPRTAADLSAYMDLCVCTCICVRCVQKNTYSLGTVQGPTIQGSQQDQRLLRGPQPHIGNNDLLLRVVGQVTPEHRAPHDLLVPAVRSEAIHRESRHHDDEVHQHKPVGEIRSPGEWSGEAERRWREKEDEGEGGR